VWDRKTFVVLGKKMTLDAIEHKRLRKEFDEPRIHVSLVCAAMGCPPLRSEAYTSEKLNAQLDDQAKVFLKNPIKFRIDRQDSTIYLSPIFKWYGEDFVDKFTPEAGLDGLNKTERAVLNFCSRHLSDADQKYLAAGGYSVRYLDYNWSLNEKKVKK